MLQLGTWLVEELVHDLGGPESAAFRALKELLAAEGDGLGQVLSYLWRQHQRGHRMALPGNIPVMRPSSAL